MSTNFSGIAAADYARQHNGNVYNNQTFHYTLRQRRSDETMHENAKNNALLKAAAAGQTRRLEYLIQIGADRDFADEYGMTALHHAAFSGFEDTVRSLLLAGVDVDAHSPSHGTPLCIAAFKGRNAVLRILLEERAAVNAEGGWMGSALHAACYSADPSTVKVLLDAGATIDLQTPVRADCLPSIREPEQDNQDEYAEWVLELTPIHMIAILPPGTLNATVCDLLIERGADLKASLSSWRTKDWPVPLPGSLHRGQTALMMASLRSHHEAVQYLLAHKIQPGVQDSSGDHALMFACLAPCPRDIIDLLVSNGANVDMTNDVGHTAFHKAAVDGRTNAMECLVAAGADVNTRDHKGFVPLTTVARSPDSLQNTIESLIRLGADMTVRTDGCSALHFAATCNHELIEALIRAGISSEVTDRDGRTPLIDAARLNNTYSIEALTKLGANIEAQDNLGYTSLSTAVLHGCVQSVAALIGVGAHLDARNRFGDTVIIICVRARGFFEKAEIIRMLHHAGADVNAEGEYHWTALMQAANDRRYLMQQRVDLVRLLLRLGADPRKKTRFGETARSIAEKAGNIGVVKWLKKAGG